MIKTVYLAGKMSGRRWSDIVEERTHARALLEAAGIKILDPIRGEDFADDRILENSTLSTAPNGRCNVQRDLMDIREADATIVLNADMLGFGTAFEWAYSHFLGKPVFIVSTRTLEELGMWRVEMSTAAFYIIENLVDHLKRFWR